jgi:hypothetical protein
MMDAKLWLTLVGAFCLAACTGGGGPSCDLSGGTMLATTTWPKFRADTANSGRAIGVDLTQSTGNGTALFDGHCSVTMQQTCTVETDTPPCPTGETCMPIGPISATPILGPTSIFVASSDANVYVVNYQGQSITLSSQIKTQTGIAGSPLLGSDGTLFVPSNTQLSQFFADGALRNSANLSGSVSASPNIWNGDGTTFIGTQSGSFEAVCPNGVSRFTESFPATQSTAALTQDPNVTSKATPLIIGGGANGQVRAYTLRGRQYWSFFASTNIVAAVLIDESQNPKIFYVADTSGQVSAAYVANGLRVTYTVDGLPPIPFSFAAATGITASPALGRDEPTLATLYVVDQSGTLYAINGVGTVCPDTDPFCIGKARWTYHPADSDLPMMGDALSVSSSPAVATGGDSDVIVFAADVIRTLDLAQGPVAVGGRVYAVRDDGGQGTEIWFSDEDGLPGFNVGHSIGTSSPAIAAPPDGAPAGTNGTVYIGRQGARLVTPTGQDPYVVNDGGALYAIAP